MFKPLVSGTMSLRHMSKHISKISLKEIRNNKRTITINNFYHKIQSRSFSTSNEEKPKISENEPNATVTEDTASQSKAVTKPLDFDEYDDYEAPRNAKESVAQYAQSGFYLALIGLGLYGLYYIGDALFPGRMSPYSLFNEAFEIVKINDEVRHRCKLYEFTNLY